MAIRREDQSLWERRAPLAPHHVRKLIRKGKLQNFLAFRFYIKLNSWHFKTLYDISWLFSGVKVIVQPSNRRAYPMQAYANAGAIIKEDISEASVIFGVKQVPVDCLQRDKTFVFFSHTIKVSKWYNVQNIVLPHFQFWLLFKGAMIL